MISELQPGRSAPSALDRHLRQGRAHQLADPRTAIHVRDDLEQERRQLYGSKHPFFVHRLVLIAHGAGCDTYAVVVQRPDQSVSLHFEIRASKYLGKSPQLAAAGNWSM